VRNGRFLLRLYSCYHYHHPRNHPSIFAQIPNPFTAFRYNFALKARLELAQNLVFTEYAFVWPKERKRRRRRAAAALYRRRVLSRLLALEWMLVGFWNMKLGK
jgi:hypothetical protein